jgi:hypothetical protein
MEKIEHDIWGNVVVIYYPSETKAEVVKSHIAENKLREQVLTLPEFADQFLVDAVKPSQN